MEDKHKKMLVNKHKNLFSVITDQRSKQEIVTEF